MSASDFFSTLDEAHLARSLRPASTCQAYLLIFDCSTAEKAGWAQLKNGDLFQAAEFARFDVLVTAKNASTGGSVQIGRLLGQVFISALYLWP
jgi:hypothetical protein